MKTLYPYQSEDKKAIEEAWELYKSVLYQLPTGGGKSIVITSLIQDYKNEKILIFAHKRKLLLQLQKHLKSVGITAGVLAGGLQEDLDSNIIIVSIMTAAKNSRLETLLERDWDKVFIDEARHSRTNSYDKVLEALEEKHPLCKLLGVDATPYRKDKKRLDKHFQHMVVSSETVASLMEKGYLQKCKAIISPINLEELQAEVVEVANDYQVAALSTYMRKQKYLDYVVSQYTTYGEGRPAIVFAVDKAHSESLMNTFIAGGYAGKVERVDSSLSVAEITAIYERYESGVTQILINVEMITEGVDLPNTGCIIGARPTKSLTLYMQMVGRGMRLDGVNEYFLLLDCCGWTEEYGVASTPKTWSLNPEIHPNSGRIGNKIFGKREDGTLTQDLEMFIGEVIEMTPEEYMSSLEGGEENARDINSSIDVKIQAIYKKMLDLLIDEKRYKDFNVECKEEYKETVFVFTHKAEDRRYYSANTVTIEFSKKFLHAVSNKDMDSAYSRVYFDSQILNGILNTNLVDNVKYTKVAREMIEQVKDLQKSKINLDKFRLAKQAMADAQRELEIEEGVKSGLLFEFPEKFGYAAYFKETSSEDAKYITAVSIPNKKLQMNNFMTIHYYTSEWDWQTRTNLKKEGIEENKYIRKDKFIEILKDHNWEPNQK